MEERLKQLSPTSEVTENSKTSDHAETYHEGEKKDENKAHLSSPSLQLEHPVNVSGDGTMFVSSDSISSNEESSVETKAERRSFLEIAETAEDTNLFKRIHLQSGLNSFTSSGSIGVPSPGPSCTSTGDIQFKCLRYLDEGSAPCVAVRNDQVLVVYQTENNVLYYQSGKIQDDNISWYAAAPYGVGTQPVVDFNLKGTVVEAHTVDKSRQWMIGYLCAETLNISWQKAVAFNDHPHGTCQSIGISNNNIVMAVYQLRGPSCIWLQIGSVVRDGQNKKCVWHYLKKYAAGSNPKISVRDSWFVVLHVEHGLFTGRDTYARVGKTPTTQKARIKWLCKHTLLPFKENSYTDVTNNINGDLFFASVGEDNRLTWKVGSLDKNKILLGKTKCGSFLERDPVTVQFCFHFVL
eukprot:TRINITY_DN10201_c0_g1_i2.p1 TRINITY_DN10201_c0_g1~~TRINITY_DN10201_c0_g1_i2.p1  ORF type:complete len:454 (-),score=92.59 TRINITY_DN10201_c0_g1_i2:243-1466(-)